MGREWYLNWGTKSSSKKAKANGDGVGRGHGGGRSGIESRGGEKKASAPPTAAAAAAAAAASAGGCMNAVLHLFDFQHFQLCLHPQDSTSFFPDDPTPPKGVEAPRNSLESITEEDKDDYLCVAKDGIRIKTNRRDAALKLVQAPRGKVEDLSSESSCSPAGARTPNVVARLMGLEILPESNNTTPRSSSHSQISPHIIRTSSSTTTPITTKSSSKKTRVSNINNHNESPGPRSVPETPRSSATWTRRRSTDVVDSPTKSLRRRRSTDVVDSPTKSSRRRSTDVVDHHRLSLQINKENSIQKEMELSRPSCSAISTKRKDGKNSYLEEEVTKSPSYYARQIMKQVRETVSRRVGVDITNTIGSERSREHRRDEHLLSSSSTTTTTTTTLSKPKKSSKKDRQLSPLSSSSSPKLKIYGDENNNNNTRTITVCLNQDQPTPPVVTEVLSNTVTTVVEEKPRKSEDESTKTRFSTASNNSSSSKPSLICNKKQLKSCDSIKNKKDEQFVRPSTTTTTKKSKKTILSSESVPSLVSFKKDSSSLTTKLLDYQGISSNAQLSKPIITSNGTSTTTSTTTTTRLSRYPRQRIIGQRVEEATHAPTDRWRNRKDATTAVTNAMEFQYISRILKCTGIDRDTPVSFMRWYLPSHPLDPSIFHILEATHYHATSNNNSSCESFNLTINRKLIFHLVDEMLVDLLKPYNKLKHHYHLRRHHHCHKHLDEQDQQINGFQLVKILCSKIRGFPSSDCQTLQDIDALVEKDLPGFGAASNLIAYQEEGEDIVSEIERGIIDSLVQEIICMP